MAEIPSQMSIIKAVDIMDVVGEESIIRTKHLYEQ